MKTAIVFYSFSGNTRKYAIKMAAERNASIFEVFENGVRSRLSAFIPGCFQSRGQKAVSLRQPIPKLDEFDTIVIMAPIWAGYPAPAFNSIIELLPEGKKVEIVLLSASGRSAKGKLKTTEQIAARGCSIVSYKDIKTGKK